jgi:hypothetical protein
VDEEALDGDAGRPKIVVALCAVDVEHAMRNFGIVAKKLKLWTATEAKWCCVPGSVS